MKAAGLILLFAAALAIAQGKPKPEAPAASDTISAYLVPDDLKLKIRDAQLEWQELEADTQAKLVQIEKNKARQKDVTDEIRILAYQFAQRKQIDLKVWEIDAKQLKFVKKKAATK